MLGHWNDWAPCEAKCDVGRRSRQRPFLIGDVRHYESDLERQVFSLEFGNERLQKQKNLLLLNITSLQRDIERLQGDKKLQANSLRRDRTEIEALTVNLTHAKFIREGLEREIQQLKNAHKEPRLRQRAPTSPPVLQPTPTVAVDNTDQVGAFTGLALLVFVAALGVTCACVGCGCTKLLRRRPRVHAFDDRPEHPDTSEEDILKRDDEAQPWRPVRLEENQLSGEQAIPAE
jgi:hypothetical protein